MKGKQWIESRKNDVVKYWSEKLGVTNPNLDTANRIINSKNCRFCYKKIEEKNMLEHWKEKHSEKSGSRANRDEEICRVIKIDEDKEKLKNYIKNANYFIEAAGGIKCLHCRTTFHSSVKLDELKEHKKTEEAPDKFTKIIRLIVRKKKQFFPYEKYYKKSYQQMIIPKNGTVCKIVPPSSVVVTSTSYSCVKCKGFIKFPSNINYQNRAKKIEVMEKHLKSCLSKK